MLKIVNIRNSKRLFNKCSSFHDVSSLSKINVGPPLWKLVGRDCAKIREFRYSNNFKNLVEIWNLKKLFYFLDSPKKYFSETKINFVGILNEVDRWDFITYLSFLK